MKHHSKALLMVIGSLIALPAQAGWTDWFSGLDGVYVGGALHVTKATGQLDRRLGGENDPGGFSIAEPAFNTTALLRAGWLPVSFIGIEAQYGKSIDTDRVENADNTQTIKLDSLYGIYVKPQFTYADSITLFGMAGLSDFDYSIRRPNANPPDSGSFSDSGFAWGGGIRLQLSASGTVAFEYMQHYDEDDGRVFGVGVSVNYRFGQESEDTGFY